jgi:hypothetical protein
MSQTFAQLINGKSATVEFSAGSASTPAVSFSGDTNTGIYSPGADQVAISTNGSGRLYVDASGNVGINKFALSQTFHVLSASGGTTARFENSSTGNFIDFFETGGGTRMGYIGHVTATGMFVHNDKNGPIVFDTNNTERMRLDSSGRLGLGTSSPGRRLVIAGDTNTVCAIQGANNGTSSLFLGDTDAESIGAFTYNHVSNHLEVTVNAAERMRIDSSGRVGIGTTTPSQALQIVTAGEPLKLQSTTAGNNYIIHAHNSSGNIGLLGAGGGGAISSGASTDYAICAAQGSLLFASNGNNERGRFDTSGRLLVGTSTASSAGAWAQYAFIKTQGNTSAATGPGVINIARGEAATAITTDENIGAIAFTDQAGNEFAVISSAADADAGSGDYPGRLVFSTTADGASSPTERMRIASTGRITIEANSTTGGIYVNNWSTGAGNSTVKYSSTTGQLTYDTSSRLVKTDIEDCPYGLEQIKLLRPRQYFRVDDQRNEIGFVADEVASVMPEFVPVGPKSIITKNEDDTEEIPLAVNYDKITAVLTKALQQALTKIETLEAKVAALEAS